MAREPNEGLLLLQQRDPATVMLASRMASEEHAGEVVRPISDKRAVGQKADRSQQSGNS